MHSLKLFNKTIAALICTVFTAITLCPPEVVHSDTLLNLPAPGNMVLTTKAFEPARIQGMTIYPKDPFSFDFIINKGDDISMDNEEHLRAESMKMIKYFMASLTVPERDMWVNLS
ncbi:conserved hypothetical protein, secreted, partial [Candidatus Magnetomorum sp. HK-1]